MLFEEEPNSKIWVAQKCLFLPNSVMDEVFINQFQKLPVREQVIYRIGSLPSIVQMEYIDKGINLDLPDLKLLSYFRRQYRDISKWLRVLVISDDKVKAELEKTISNLVKPFADYYYKMLEVLEICLDAIGIGKKILYSLWFDMVRSHFVESLKNSGFLMPLSNNHPKSNSIGISLESY